MFCLLTIIDIEPKNLTLSETNSFMPTFLFDQTIFGPVRSRRLGLSLGINLLPNSRKVCSFDCIYCECGLNETTSTGEKLPTRDQVRELLEEKLTAMSRSGELPDVITFAGNGEPTLHPDFAGVVDDVIVLRNQYCPRARIAVLSNATRIQRSDVYQALLKVDDNILKLDGGREATICQLDRPVGAFSLEALVNHLMHFQGQLTIQTMFVKGRYDGAMVDNTTAADVEPWLQLLNRIKPSQVMIYTIERDTPFDTLQKVSLAELSEIAEKVRILGIPVQVSG